MKKRISIIIFTILLIIIRLLNINSYVSLACGFGLLYEIIIGYSYLLKKKLNKKLCQTIPISIICIVIVITIFGFFNLLLPGAIILYALGIISFIYLYIKEEFKILDIFNNRGNGILVNSECLEKYLREKYPNYRILKSITSTE